MNHPYTLVRLAVLTAIAAASAGAAGPATQSAPVLAPSHPLTKTVQSAVRSVQSAHEDWKLKDEDIAVTLVDLRDPARPTSGSFRGDVPIYPASVVKLFYLAAAQRWMEDGRLQDTSELRRGLKDMIVDSSNDATGYVLEALTDAPNGAELPENEMVAWADRRNAVNRYFASLAYERINVCQKPYAEGPYGRERVFLGPKFENRNKLTTDATARLLSEIVLYRSVTPDRSRQMMNLLQRDLSKASKDPDDQTNGFTGIALGPKDKLFSKAGWTSTSRHDAAYVETPDGLRFVLVTFTTGHANRRQIIPEVAASVMKQLRDVGAAGR